jgi:hypothetical protein
MLARQALYQPSIILDLIWLSNMLHFDSSNRKQEGVERHTRLLFKDASWKIT